MCRTCLSRTRTGRGPCFLSALPLVTLLYPPPPTHTHTHIWLSQMRAVTHTHTQTHRVGPGGESTVEDLASLPIVRLGKLRGRCICVRLLLATSLGLGAFQLLLLSHLETPPGAEFLPWPAGLRARPWLYVVCGFFEKSPQSQDVLEGAPPLKNTHKYAPTHTSSNQPPPFSSLSPVSRHVCLCVCVCVEEERGTKCASSVCAGAYCV